VTVSRLTSYATNHRAIFLCDFFMETILFSGSLLPPCLYSQKHKEIRTMNLRDVFTGPEREEKGVTTVEYAVMLVLVAIAVLAFGTGIAQSVTGVFSRLASSLG